MESLDVRQAAQLWKVSERKVTALCREGRIPGAYKNGKNWVLPGESTLPPDGRTKESFRAEKDEKTPASTGFSSEDTGSKAAETFEQIYHREAQTLAFTPYRVCHR